MMYTINPNGSEKNNVFYVCMCVPYIYIYIERGRENMNENDRTNVSKPFC